MASEGATSRPVGAGIIFHVGAEVLLQKRTADAPRWPSKWAVFGGGVEAGETPEAAAAREALEELGVEVDAAALDPVCAFSVYAGEIIGTAYYFSAPLPVPLSELKLMEGCGFALFGAGELDGLNMVPHGRLAVDQFFERLLA